MKWKAVKHSLQPTAGEAWYVSDQPADMVHCGTGEEGEKRAERVANLLNLGQVAEVSQDRDFYQMLRAQLDALSRAALDIDVPIVEGALGIREGHPLRPVLHQVQTVKKAADTISEMIMMGAAHYRPKKP